MDGRELGNRERLIYLVLIGAFHGDDLSSPL